MKLKTLLVALLCTSLAAAQTPNSQLTPNWPDATVAAVAAAVGDITGITFIVDPTAAQRKISFVNRTPMRPREIYDKFLTILSVNALIAVPAGTNTMKIVQEANGRTLPGRELGAAGVGPDELVHAVIPVKNINAQQVATVLQQLRSQYGVVQAVPGTNSIIVNDPVENWALRAKFRRFTSITITYDTPVAKVKQAVQIIRDLLDSEDFRGPIHDVDAARNQDPPRAYFNEFNADSLTLPGVVRDYKRFSDAADENGASRMYAGIHFVHAVKEGRRQGRSIGRAVAEALPLIDER